MNTARMKELREQLGTIITEAKTYDRDKPLDMSKVKSLDGTKAEKEVKLRDMGTCRDCEGAGFQAR